MTFACMAMEFVRNQGLRGLHASWASVCYLSRYLCDETPDTGSGHDHSKELSNLVMWLLTRSRWVIPLDGRSEMIVAMVRMARGPSNFSERNMRAGQHSELMCYTRYRYSTASPVQAPSCPSQLNPCARQLLPIGRADRECMSTRTSPNRCGTRGENKSGRLVASLRLSPYPRSRSCNVAIMETVRFRELLLNAWVVLPETQLATRTA